MTSSDRSRANPVIRVVAPSGPVPADRFALGLRVLTNALEPPQTIDVDPSVHARAGYLAGLDPVRKAALQTAVDDPSVEVIWCARGGYGATRLLSQLDASSLGDRAPLIVGFSDVTALLAWAWTKHRRLGLHAPVITQLGGLHPDDVDRVSTWIRGDVPAPLCADEGTVVRGGTVEGPMIGGNLEVLRSLVGTPYFPDLTGCVLALEDVGERPYRLDRALTQMLDSHTLRGVSAIVTGQWTACDEPRAELESPTAEAVVLERLERLSVPLVTGFGFGHDPIRNAAWPFGGRVRLRADDATIEFLEPVR